MLRTQPFQGYRRVKQREREPRLGTVPETNTLVIKNHHESILIQKNETTNFHFKQQDSWSDSALTSPSSFSSSNSSSATTHPNSRSISLSPESVRCIFSSINSPTSPNSYVLQGGEYMAVYDTHDIEQNNFILVQEDPVNLATRKTEPRTLFRSCIPRSTVTSTFTKKTKKSHVFLLPPTQEPSSSSTVLSSLSESSLYHQIILGTSLSSITTNRAQLENNVHDKSVIKTKRVQYASKELDENEMYANEIGLHFSPDQGDYYSFPQTHLIDHPELSQDIMPCVSMISPQHGKADQGRIFRHVFGDISQLDNFDSPLALKPASKSRLEYERGSSHSPVVHHHLITPQSRRNMVENDVDLARIRKQAAQLCIDWASPNHLTPSVARRLRDFEFAQEKRAKLLGDVYLKWGVIGLYDFLTAVRTDIEWAEDAAHRRAIGRPYKPWLEFTKLKKTGYNRPYLTFFIIITTTISFIVSIGLNNWTIASPRINPMIGPTAETLVKMGAKDSDLIVNQYQWWRLLTTTFLHAGLIHYIMNCFAIYYVCRPVEQNHGSIAVGLIFLSSSIGANVVSATFMPEYATVGASGGIFGLLGCCLADIFLNRRVLFSDFVNKGRSRKHHICVILTLLFDLTINILIGLTPMIDNFTHLGGLFFGFLCGLCLMDPMVFDSLRKREIFCVLDKLSRFQLIASLTSITILVACITLLYIGNGLTSPCPACKVLSCVPFPWWGSKKWYTCDIDKCHRAVVQGVTLNGSGDITSVLMTCPTREQEIYYVNMQNVAIDTWIQENYVDICRKICKN